MTNPNDHSKHLPLPDTAGEALGRMDRDAIVAIFDEQRAASYDSQLNNIGVMHDTLMLSLRMALADLPDDARILCVGCGTGTELIRLAEMFPGWSFTAVEPAPAMMAQCRAKVDAAGITSRCTFHDGFLDTLPDSMPDRGLFNAATCLLVSHFFPDIDEREAFYAAIGARLEPGGCFVNQDLSWPSVESGNDVTMGFWVRMMQFAGAEITRDTYEAAMARAVGLLSPPEMEALLQRSGFEHPAHVFRLMMLGTWVSRWRGAVKHR